MAKMSINPIELQKHLKGMDYPASKQAVIQQAERNDAPEDRIQALEGMDKETFDGPSAVQEAVKSAS